MKRKTRMYFIAGVGAVMALGMTITSFAATGWTMENGEWRYYLRDGEAVTDDWKKSGDNWFYLGDDGRMVKSSLIEDGDDYYYVNSAGARVSNEWRQLPNEDPDDGELDEVWYYFQSSGKAYKAPNSGKTSFKSIKISSGETKKYAFNDKGHMLFGWVNEESQHVSGDEAWKEGVYYCGEEGDGAMVSQAWRLLEAQDDDNNDSSYDGQYWFYFQANGKKAANTKKTINGGKYLFLENGNAQYEWHSTPSDASSSGSPSDATKNSYYKRPDQCWLATGWFYTVPSEELDPEGYANDESYWFYGLNGGGVVTSQIKTINGQPYGFDDKGRMLYGLYKLEVKDKEILSYEQIESESDFPSPDDPREVYYFGDSPKEGVMETGKCNVNLDGERYTYYFNKSGSGRGAGVNGIYDGAIYEKGRLLTIESGVRYGIIVYDGKEYLVNQSGKIQKNKKNLKDADGIYYSSDKDGIVTHRGDKE